MSRPALLFFWVAAALLDGCASVTLKPARMADLRVGEQVAGIPLRPNDSFYAESLRRALRSQPEDHIVHSLSGYDMLALTGLPEGDFSELRLYLHQSHSDDDQSFEAVMALRPPGGVKRSAEEQARTWGFELGQTVALATEFGEVVSTSLPNIYALLRPVGDNGPRELHGVLSVLLRATAFGFNGNTQNGPTRVGDVLQMADARGIGRPVQGRHCCDSFPAVLLPSQLEARYDQALAAGELEVARTHLTMLRGLRSANAPQLDARYEALRLQQHTATVTALKSGLGAAANLRLEALIGALEKAPLDRLPDGTLDPETEGLLRGAIADLLPALDKVSAVERLPELVKVLQTLAAAPAGHLLEAVWAASDDMWALGSSVALAVAASADDLAALQTFKARLPQAGRAGLVALLELNQAAQRDAVRSDGYRDFADEVQARTLAALTADAAAAEARGHFATAAGLHLLRHAVSREPAPPARVSLLAASSAEAASPSPMVQAQRALAGLAVRYWPAFDPDRPEAGLANRSTELTALGRVTELGGLSVSAAELVELARRQAVPLVSLELGPWTFPAAVAKTTRVEQVEGSYSQSVQVSNSDAVNAYIRRSNELLARQSELSRQIRADDEAAQSTTQTTSTLSGGGKELAPQGSKYVYQDSARTMKSTTTTKPGDAAAGQRAEEGRAEYQRVTAELNALKRPPDLVGGRERATWTHEELVQEWVGTATRHVTLRAGPISVDGDCGLSASVHSYRRVKADPAHNVAARDEWKSPEAFEAVQRAEAAGQTTLALQGLVNRLIDARRQSDRSRLSGRGSKRELELELAWADFLQGRDPSPALAAFVPSLEPIARAQSARAGSSKTRARPAPAPETVGRVIYAQVVYRGIAPEKVFVENPVVSAGRSQGVHVGDYVFLGVDKPVRAFYRVASTTAQTCELEPHPENVYPNEAREPMPAFAIDVGTPVVIYGPAFAF